MPDAPNSTKRILADHTLGDMTARYLVDDESKRVGLLLLPTSRVGDAVDRRDWLSGVATDGIARQWGKPFQAWRVDPLVQLRDRADAAAGQFEAGLTYSASQTTWSIRLVDQALERETVGGREAVCVLTRLEVAEGEGPVRWTVEHRLGHEAGEPFLRCATRVMNVSDEPRTLDHLTSFNLGHVSPFAEADAAQRLVLHRFRSYWSAEARLVSDPLEQLHLGRVWAGFPTQSEKFGSVGSMPTRGYFPSALLEDTQADVAWGASLAWAGSWQMELRRVEDTVSLSGGLADRGLGHWSRVLQPGEALQGPVAFLTVCDSQTGPAVEIASQRLTAAQLPPLEHPQEPAAFGLGLPTQPKQPDVEADLPVTFNDWCTFWGDPNHDKLMAIADRLKGSAVRYQVIDDGWQGEPGQPRRHGDWIPSLERFPDGLSATCAAIRERGLVPGIWFEWEMVYPNTDCLRDHEAAMISVDGRPLFHGNRYFWDLRQETSHRELEARVIDLIEANGIGYVKLDYNASIGLGADELPGESLGAGLPGEGLRRHIEGVHRLYERLRERLPELVVELCASGGNRIEPSLLGRTTVASFSDAHEGEDIPIVAANLHRVMQPRQSSIWAVLHPTDSVQRLSYSMSATFLGRVCLSGPINELSDAQWSYVEDGLAVYEHAKPAIRDGFSQRFGTLADSEQVGATPIAYHQPSGWQAVRRVSTDGQSAVVVAHTFGADSDSIPDRLIVPMPEGTWEVVGMVHDNRSAAEPTVTAQDGLVITPATDDPTFAGWAVVLQRR